MSPAAVNCSPGSRTTAATPSLSRTLVNVAHGTCKTTKNKHFLYTRYNFWFTPRRRNAAFTGYFKCFFFGACVFKPLTSYASDLSSERHIYWDLNWRCLYGCPVALSEEYQYDGSVQYRITITPLLVTYAPDDYGMVGGDWILDHPGCNYSLSVRCSLTDLFIYLWIY